VNINGQYEKTDDSLASFFANAVSGAQGWSPLQEYLAHTEISKQGTPASVVYFIENGIVKMTHLEPSGHEVIAGLRRRNWIIGATAVLLGKKYSFTATTLVDCRLRHISSKGFLSLIETNPDFSRHILKILSQEIYVFGKAFCNISCVPAIDRLKRLLYEIMTESKQPLDLSDKVKIYSSLKHKELAQMIAVTPEHLSRLLKRLERDRIIAREQGLIVLNNNRSLTKEQEIKL
jgi:CRP/FNR family transcriptional regulator